MQHFYLVNVPSKNRHSYLPVRLNLYIYLTSKIVFLLLGLVFTRIPVWYNWSKPSIWNYKNVVGHGFNESLHLPKPAKNNAPNPLSAFIQFKKSNNKNLT